MGGVPIVDGAEGVYGTLSDIVRCGPQGICRIRALVLEPKELRS